MSPGAPPVVRLLGPAGIDNGDGLVVPARLDRIVLAHLALAEGRAVPFDDLVEAVWDDEPPDGARNALQVKISRLRRHLAAHGEALQHVHGSYRLRLAAAQVDTGRFTALAHDATMAHAAGDRAAAMTLVRQALDLWRGMPLAGLGEHPRLVAARARLFEQHTGLRELFAELELHSPVTVAHAIVELRDLLAEDALRPRPRLLLMRALEQTGRRAEALAVYDVGRQVLAERTGLAPPAELQHEFERLLIAERDAAHRDQMQVRAHMVPAGAMDTARWLAAEGSHRPALELAFRGSWWWWLSGRRSQARDLLEDLIGICAAGGTQAPAMVGATAWLAVFDAVTESAEEAISSGEAALRQTLDLDWDRPQSVAALLLAERLFQRGEPDRAGFLLRAGRRHLERAQDEWGIAMAGLIAAKGELQRGAVGRSATTGQAAFRVFEHLSDPAGQMMALDHVGYCAEITGDLTTAARTHRRALGLARRSQAPEWEATQLSRLGSVHALLGDHSAITTLRDAVSLADSVGSAAVTALANNGLGLAHGLTGRSEQAAEIHAETLEWYERQGSPAGMSYTTGRLALSLAEVEPQQATVLACRALRLATQTRDPRAVAHALEAVTMAHSDAPIRARALGGARALRRHTRAPLPPPMTTTINQAQRQLEVQLGAALLDHMRRGAHEVRTRVLVPAGTY